ncbi:hypothetical protein DFH06DRAFT_1347916 [Mycena polygramma]|nr:hypothetical protein DFH06DRAFT_1347916 [Mycena polygramma]
MPPSSGVSEASSPDTSDNDALSSYLYRSRPRPRHDENTPPPFPYYTPRPTPSPRVILPGPAMLLSPVIVEGRVVIRNIPRYRENHSFLLHINHQPDPDRVARQQRRRQRKEQQDELERQEWLRYRATIPRPVPPPRPSATRVRRGPLATAAMREAARLLREDAAARLLHEDGTARAALFGASPTLSCDQVETLRTPSFLFDD